MSTTFGFAQPCQWSISGYVLDQGTGIPLEYSTVFLEHQKKGVTVDSSGFFKLDQLCPDDYHLVISHIGCQPEVRYLSLDKDTQIYIYLNHHTELLDEVIIHGSKEENSAQVSSSIGRKEIEQNSHKNLSDILEGITGVSVLKNGSGISKPVIHGLYGNRVAILNNGIEQAGQQWGNDHAPEIDPFIANHLAVVKGAGALAYGGNSLGSVVLVETDKISEDPHLHGLVNYIFESNGLGNTLNFQLEKNNPWAAWRISSTLKKSGDTKSPDYFLTNTGKQEANLAVQIEKSWSKQWSSDFYFSSFNTEIGVLRGAHIGNLTDLELALDKEVPFFTEAAFSYDIAAPRQQVGHHLVKLESKYFLAERKVFKFKYGGQLNQRKEFDVRRNGRSDIPAMSLEQYSHFAELTFNQSSEQQVFLKSGIQYKYVNNTNNPETGILPLIPNYNANTVSTFLILQKEKRDLFFEAGGRYDLKVFDVATISQSLPRTVERFDHRFHNYSFSGGVKYEPITGFKLNLNLGHMLRAPEVNELYSFGLHQGVSGIEEGSRSLNSERSVKGVFSIDWRIKNKFFLQALGYSQKITDYIYLQPQDEFRLTIRGAFPVFIYEQTDAQINGLDFLISYEPVSSVKWLFKYAHVNGKDLSNELALINIPSDNLFSSFSFGFADSETFKQNTFSINGKYVFRQRDIIASQDFVVPPEAYFLCGLNVGTTIQLPASTLRFSLSIENLLNKAYRDYLNRLRYFADDRGFGLNFNLKYGF